MSGLGSYGLIGTVQGGRQEQGMLAERDVAERGRDLAVQPARGILMPSNRSVTTG